MFTKLCTLALVARVASALTLNGPSTPWTSTGTVTITWTATTTDPSSFSLQLTNTIFHSTYAIANNVPTANGVLTFTLPELPTGDGYTLEAFANNNVNDVYSQTGDFAVVAATTTTTSAASTTSSVTSTSSGTLSTPSTTSPVSSVSAVVTSAATSATGTAASSTPSSFSSGASSFKMPGMVPAAALVLSAVAGAAMVF